MCSLIVKAGIVSCASLECILSLWWRTEEGPSMNKGGVRILTGGLIGLLVGSVFVRLLLPPPLWERMPPTDARVTIVYGHPDRTEQLVTVSTADGSVLQLSGLQPSLSWRPSIPRQEGFPYALLEPCDPRLPKILASAWYSVGYSNDRAYQLPYACSNAPDYYDPSPGGMLELRGGSTGFARCNLSSEAFSRLTRPPQGVKSCVQIWTGCIGKCDTVVYAVDASGTPWRWQLAHNQVGPTDMVLDIVLLAACCSSAGMFVAWYPQILKLTAPRRPKERQ